MMDQRILKSIFLTNSYQIPKNFPKKLKTIVKYIFRTENFVDISFETIPHLFKTYGTTIPAYHHVYIKHNKEPLVPQQKPKWEMTRQNDFPLVRMGNDFPLVTQHRMNQFTYICKGSSVLNVW